MGSKPTIVRLHPLNGLEAERILRSAWDAVHGPGAWGDLDLLRREDMIRAAMETAERISVGSAVYAY